MRKAGTLFTLLGLLSLVFPTYAQNYGPWNGTLVFHDNSDLQCTFSINPFGSEEVFLVKTDSILYEFKISEVKSFSYFDKETNMIKYFKNFRLKMKGETKYKRRFFEEVHRTDFISILEGKDINIKVHLDRFGQPVGNTKIKEKPHKYLLNHQDSTAYPFSEIELRRITNNYKDEITYFVKKKNIRLWLKNIDDFIAVIDYYSALRLTNSSHN